MNPYANKCRTVFFLLLSLLLLVLLMSWDGGTTADVSLAAEEEGAEEVETPCAGCRATHPPHRHHHPPPHLKPSPPPLRQAAHPAAGGGSGAAAAAAGGEKRLRNHFNLSFPINIEDACSAGTVEVIMPVSSAVYNFDRRVHIRQNSTQAKFADDPRNSARIIFFVALPSAKLTDPWRFDERLRRESRVYGDIVQININETYLNLVYKSIAVLYWTSLYCSNADFVLRSDDDVLFDATKAVLALHRRRKRHRNFIVGDLTLDSKVVRNQKGRFYVPKTIFADAYYPPYVKGGAMGFPPSTGALLYQQATIKKVVWIEDAFISGICSKDLGIPLFDDENLHNSLIHKNRTTKPKLFVYS